MLIACILNLCDPSHPSGPLSVDVAADGSPGVTHLRRRGSDRAARRRRRAIDQPRLSHGTRQVIALFRCLDQMWTESLNHKSYIMVKQPIGASVLLRAGR
jgi:hypothetical protein